ncbi:hypothetical protein FZO89_11210 [Luteimonas viscosa]|uniref:THAP4-like heme-binding beta-barrel domain-containing protein n=1 Tax=Luteimonas viscosa TaxID=1132694 RepID=A0A5D4XUU8_9GAMM|nr:hypothetical protein [Luteimonas viscosa]TYT26782.1 hypothetical protein FZO89_11210 [Luteimonas viscosa]
MFTLDQFRQLAFLQGRWTGDGPDGTPFFEEYAFVDASTLRSTRYADARFAEATDSSTVAFADGIVTSTWNGFSWRASAIGADAAAFEPVEAPSAFSWSRGPDDTLEVVQRWSDDQGRPQQYTLVLRRIRD